MKPRSGELKYLDACMKEYDKNRGSRQHYDMLCFAFDAWAGKKSDAELSIRNKEGAVTQLLGELVDFREKHMPMTFSDTKLRSNALLRDIKQGAKLLTEGKLKPQIKVEVSVGIVDSGKGKGTVVWEEFDNGQLMKARKAWSDAFDGAKMAYEALLFKIGNDNNEQIRFQRWFGKPDRAAIETVREGARKMWHAFKSSKVTIVLREDIVTHIVQTDPFAPMKDHFKGSDVYGFVWNHKAGSGYRVIMGQWFLADPDPIEGAAQTIYHELSHKVLGTVDNAYGKIKSRGFAAAQQNLALTNADNWGYYAMSFLKDF
jgi:hypothetical protein